MSAIENTPPLTRSSVQEAHALIKAHIHLTPTITSTTLTTFASTPQSPSDLVGTEWEGQPPAKPVIRFFFKCENQQRIGAFKARGAFHALARLGDEGRRGGVVTHSSGNHAQALALAAKTFGIPAHIIMPTISTPSKIAGTKSQGAHIVFSGSTSREREAVLVEVMKEYPDAVVVPPYDHPDIILGQGTASLELQQQAEDLGEKLDAIIAPLGGGGLLGGTATAMSGTGIRVFGSEPRFQGANDGERGLKAGKRVEDVSTLTIADGLRTPVGLINWSVISDPDKVKGIYSVTEEQIKKAMRLVLERMKVVVEPSGCVPLAVALYNEDFRRLVEKEAGEKGWNIGIIFSGGNTTVEAIGKLFEQPKEVQERAEGKVGLDGESVAENVAG
ncbi:tryptophan synthase beta subunit-like PLP-dependent enzyme [Venturia nashicola]|nr:tryptophan synthase beta subunit-like PLP-dependent enzyme [Venturia nashicola]